MSYYKKGISIIIPVYNVERYIRRCINSLYSQTFKKNIEYIFVIDKNSNDSSEQIVREMTTNKSNTIVIKSKHGGNEPGYNRNIGIEVAQKEFIGFCDADDYVEADFYQRLYDYAKIFNSDIAMGETTILDDNTNNLINKVNYPFQTEYTIGKAFSFIPWCTVWDKIFRTKLIKNNKSIRFLEGVFSSEDNIFVLKAVYNANKIITVPGSQYFWMRNNYSTTLNSNYEKQRIEDAYSAMNVSLDFLEKINIPLDEKIIVIKSFIYSFGKKALTDDERGNKLKERIRIISNNLVEV